MLTYKSISQEAVKSIDVQGRTIYGYFSATGNYDLQADLIEPGAFAKTIAERGPESSNPLIFHLWQHDATKILGKPSVLKEDSRGLYFETSIARTALGDEALTLYQEGILNQHSIGFMIPKGKYKMEDGQVHGFTKRRIQEVKLYEGSTVTWGANPKTPALGIKAGQVLTPAEAIEEHLNRLNFLIKTGELSNEEILQLLEVWKSQLMLHVDALQAKEEPVEGEVGGDATPPAADDTTPAPAPEPQSEDPEQALKSLRELSDWLRS